MELCKFEIYKNQFVIAFYDVKLRALGGHLWIRHWTGNVIDLVPDVGANTPIASGPSVVKSIWTTLLHEGLI